MPEILKESVAEVLEANGRIIIGQLEEKVREIIEETLNGLLDVEADKLCNGSHYERSPDRVDSRAAHY